MSRSPFRSIAAAAALALLALPGLALAQEKVPFTGVTPPPQPISGVLPGTSCSGSAGVNCPGAIPDNQPGNPIVSTFTFAGCDDIADVNVGLDITHTWVGDLIVTIEGPSATTVTLLDRPGVPAIGPAGCNDNDVFAVLDDEGAGGPAESACTNTNSTPGLSGDLTPTQALSAFDTQSANGTWTLRVTDNAAQDQGTLNDWTLEVTCNQGGPGPGPEPNEIPTLGEAGLVALLVLLAAAATLLLRRRRSVV